MVRLQGHKLDRGYELLVVLVWVKAWGTSNKMVIIALEKLCWYKCGVVHTFLTLLFK